MSKDVVKLDIDKRGVAWVTLNRPEKNNAYNSEMIEALLNGARSLAEDSSVRVVVLRGEGRHFQAGADLGWIQSVRATSEAENIAVSQATTDAVNLLCGLPKPVVALVQGGCFGGGTGIISACDIVIADETAMFSITEARWGLTAIPIIPQLLSRIGSGNLRRYALTCERFGAERAREIGLVDEVCAAGTLATTAEPILDALLHCPPDALAVTKASIREFAGLVFDQPAREAMARPHALKRLDAEADEGLKSFLEKRKPAWYPT